MNMEWMPNGVIGLRPYKLKEESKTQLYGCLKMVGIQSELIQPFVSALETAISEYQAMNNIISKCKPSDVRENLGNTKKQIRKLIEKINALDANSRIIINEVSEEGTTGLADRVIGIRSIIDDALEEAQKYPKKGRNVEYDKRNLVNSIADGIESIFGVGATSTKDGLLEECTAIALFEITGKSADGIHTLIEKVIKTRKKHPEK